MATQFTEFGAVPDRDKIYAKTADGSRVLFPSGYEGYDISENKVTANWVPIVVTILSDGSVIRNNHHSIEDFRIRKDVAIDQLVSEIEGIRTETQAAALLRYLSSDVEIDQTEQSKHFNLDDDEIQLFSENYPKTSGKYVKDLYNLHSLLNAILISLSDYLSDREYIEELIINLPDINRYEKYQKKMEDIKDQLKKLGEGDGIPLMENLSSHEKEQATKMIQKYEFYENLKPDDIFDSDVIYDIDIHEFHESIEGFRVKIANLDREILQVAKGLHPDTDIRAIGIGRDFTRVVSNILYKYESIHSPMTSLQAVVDHLN